MTSASSGGGVDVPQASRAEATARPSSPFGTPDGRPTVTNNGLTGVLGEQPVPSAVNTASVIPDGADAALLSGLNEPPAEPSVDGGASGGGANDGGVNGTGGEAPQGDQPEQQPQPTTPVAAERARKSADAMEAERQVRIAELRLKAAEAHAAGKTLDEKKYLGHIAVLSGLAGRVPIVSSMLAGAINKYGDYQEWRAKRVNRDKGVASRKLINREFWNRQRENLGGRAVFLTTEQQSQALEKRRQEDLDLARTMGIEPRLVGANGLPLPDVDPNDKEAVAQRAKIQMQVENVAIALARHTARVARERTANHLKEGPGFVGLHATDRGSLIGETLRPKVFAQQQEDGTVKMIAVMADGRPGQVQLNSQTGEIEFFHGHEDTKLKPEDRPVAKAQVTTYVYDPKKDEMRYVHNQFDTKNRETDVIVTSATRRNIRSNEVTQGVVRREMEEQMNGATTLTALLLSGGDKEPNSPAIFVEHGQSTLPTDGVLLFDKARTIMRGNPQYRGLGAAVIDYEGSDEASGKKGGMDLLEMGDVNVVALGDKERRASRGEQTAEVERAKNGETVHVYVETQEDLDRFNGLDSHAQEQFRASHGEKKSQKPEERVHVVVEMRTRGIRTAEVNKQMKDAAEGLKETQRKYKSWEADAKADDVLNREALQDPALRLLKLDHDGIADLKTADAQVTEMRATVDAAVGDDVRKSRLVEARRILRERFKDRLADDDGKLAKTINELAQTMYPDEKPTVVLLEDEKRSDGEDKDKYRTRLTGLYRELGGDPESVVGKGGIDAMVEASITSKERTAYVEKTAFNLRSVAHGDLVAAVAERDRLLAAEPNPTLKKAIEEAFEHEYGEEEKTAKAKRERSVVDILTSDESTVGERRKIEESLEAAGYVSKAEAERLAQNAATRQFADVGQSVVARAGAALVTNGTINRPTE